MDSFGDVRAINPPPVRDVLNNFIQRTEERKKQFWSTGALIIVNHASEILSSVGIIWLICLALPMYNVAQTMMNQIPASESEKLRRAKTFAKFYMICIMMDPDSFPGLLTNA